MNNEEIINQLKEENEYLKNILKSHHINYSPFKIIEHKELDSNNKISLFMSFFKGRDDIFAYQYLSKDGLKGCAPVCETKGDIHKFCIYSKENKCKTCPHRKLRGIKEQDIYNHLIGKDSFGIYPLLNGDYCYLLAIDFDDSDYIQSAKTFRDVCTKYKIDCLVEISQSGNGAHVWIFFQNAIKASKARKLGQALILESMSYAPGITFQSFDRMFPSQDYLPKAGYGNLIILPLNGEKAKLGYSLFVDDNFVPYSMKTQFDILSSTMKLKEEEVDLIINEIESTIKNNETKTINPSKLTKNDFNGEIDIIYSNNVKISKNSLSNKSLKALQRIGSIPNPKFYETQKIRKSTYNIPQILCLYSEDDEFIYLPKGCLNNVELLFKSIGLDYKILDKCKKGKILNAKFIGTLKAEQESGIQELIKYKNGLFVAPPAFGKTVTAIALISRLKRNTLIIVPSITLLNQWKERLETFLDVNYEYKKNNKFGVYYGAKKSLNGYIDIASIDSLENEESNKIFSSYGLVIIDEVHHVGALTYEKIVKRIPSEYLYGFTATPKRNDKYERIVYKLLGDIRYQYIDKNNLFEKILFPIFSSFNFTNEQLTLTYSDLQSILLKDESRNQLIIKNIKERLKKKMNILVLTDRIEHINLLSSFLNSKNTIIINGSQSRAANKLNLEKINTLSDGFVIISTGKFIGEGFDEKRLNCLMLVSPFKWDGTLEQYVGRLHRVNENKNTVEVLDFIDYKVPMYENMYHRRLAGYKKLGYQINGDASIFEKKIYSRNDFSNVLRNDLKCSRVSVCYFINSYDEEVIYDYLDLNKNNFIFINNSKDIEHKNIKMVSNTVYSFNMIIIDHKIIWYGGMNPFDNSSYQNYIMRIEDKSLAKSFEKELNVKL